MYDPSMNSAMNGYRRAGGTPKESRIVFLDTARTKKVKEDTVVRVYDNDGSYTQGRILCLLEEYFTVCINEETLTGIIVFRHEWENVEVISQIEDKPMFTIYGKADCPLCNKLKMVMEMVNQDYEYKVLGPDFTEEEFETLFPNKLSVPQVMLKDKYIGDCNGTIRYLKEHRVL